jgi:hypothetical protein
LPGQQLGNSCWSSSHSFTAAQASSTAEYCVDLAALFQGTAAGTAPITGSIGATSYQYFPIPTGVTLFTWVANAQDTGFTAHLGFGGQINTFNSTGTATGSTSWGWDPTFTTNPQSGTVTIPTGSVYWGGFMNNNEPAHSETQSIKLTAYCGSGGQTAPVSPCCPPDPLLEGKLDLILQMIESLRQASPSTTWTDGTVHSGLTGSGSFSFAGKPTGLRFNVTTAPSAPEIIPGNPNFYWNMGFVTPIGNATPLRGWRLVYLAESFILPVYADSCGYTLLHGTVANATELLPA